MADNEEALGFEQPLVTDDLYIVGLYKKYALGDAPSLKEIEPVALKLLSDSRTMTEGASLVMTRSVNTNETEIMMAIFNPASTAKERFETLLLFRTVERMSKEK